MHAETMAAVNRLPLGFRLDYATIAGPERVSAAGDALAGDGLPGDGLPGDGLAGERPMGLAAPRQGRGDDLKRIRGIGKQNEGRLHGLGIWHFDQIAAWTPSEVEWVGSYLAFVGRIEREDWVGQAKVLAAGGDTAFSGRVARGEVVTSLDDGSLGQGNTLALSGTRPPALGTPRAGTPDDLKLVNGIGRVIEQKLNAVGVWHFDQIAAMSDDELAWISGHVGFPGRALRENWRGECVVLAQGGETEHSRAVKAGKIPSSLAARKPEESGSGE
jgi:predicted flap endonuclease-1-like 5' DNA nuclease